MGASEHLLLYTIGYSNSKVMGKRLGQYFLIHEPTAERIVSALEIKDGDVVIEIGPGTGALTEKILAQGKNIKYIGIEKDPELARKLEQKIEDQRLKIEIIHGDVRDELPALIARNAPHITGYKLIGNIPYYLTGRLFRIVGELKHKPSLSVFTVQYEVAERLTAEPPKMNLLAASVQFWADTEKIVKIPRRRFRPIPGVESAIVRLRTKNEISTDPGAYYRTIRALFKQPRKTILNNLSASWDLPRDKITADLVRLGINPKDRPQNLNIQTIALLASLSKGEKAV